MTALPVASSCCEVPKSERDIYAVNAKAIPSAAQVVALHFSSVSLPCSPQTVIIQHFMVSIHGGRSLPPRTRNIVLVLSKPSPPLYQNIKSTACSSDSLLQLTLAAEEIVHDTTTSQSRHHPHLSNALSIYLTSLAAATRYWINSAIRCTLSIYPAPARLHSCATAKKQTSTLSNTEHHIAIKPRCFHSGFLRCICRDLHSFVGHVSLASISRAETEVLLRYEYFVDLRMLLSFSTSHFKYTIPSGSCDSNKRYSQLLFRDHNISKAEVCERYNRTYAYHFPRFYTPFRFRPAWSCQNHIGFIFEMLVFLKHQRFPSSFRLPGREIHHGIFSLLKFGMRKRNDLDFCLRRICRQGPRLFSNRLRGT